ncbi:hypothetical protein P152DRAFT_470264 [Eremomyces bilateralis CBS 781.70]|uniref:Uncharacterized protein n=1 Tax=Eremomyces bilateralis CBS 781.70 TaxID=1392243 RepID=A0A6G1GEC2_9PEZI|nr:uncharacterized protein P152DRAFT_470264 [Eremomyces bilateralis CBS 781.70]KAF1816219.1 hypothetical protein P152DRAFT_470264 [Eremomyces bilateralis CBS 781.70]
MAYPPPHPYWMPGAYPPAPPPYSFSQPPYPPAYSPPAYPPPAYPPLGYPPPGYPPAFPPPGFPHSSFYYPSPLTVGTADRPSRAIEETVQIHLCTTSDVIPWEGGPHELTFDVKEYDIEWPVERVMKYNGKGKDHKITELIERGGGFWRAGLQIAFDDTKARNPIAWYGWTGKRGKPNQRGQIVSPPVWAVITPI